jgi:hypothetical protein
MIRRLIPLLLFPLPVAAESPIAEVICAPRAEIVARLEQGQGARLAGSGLRDRETVVEVWAEPSGDWVLVQSHANGQACILAMGEVWEAVGPPPA